MIAAIHKRLEEREEGFTLIELLVVVIIIGILAAIAIPVFLNQRERAWAGTVESDLRNLAIQVETDFTENDEYPADLAAVQALATASQLPSGDDVTLTAYTLDVNDYCVQAQHALLLDDAGVPVTFAFDNSLGGLQEEGSDCA